MREQSRTRTAIRRLARKRTPVNQLTKRSSRELLLITLPALIKVFIFSYIPMVGIVIAFQHYVPRKGFFWSEFIGLQNFEYLIKSADFTVILRNSVVMNLLFIVFGTLVSMLLGLFMYEVTSKAFLKTTQTIFFFPYFIAWPIVGTILEAILGETGMMTKLIEMTSGQMIDFYSEPKYWWAIMTIVNVWKGAGVSAVTNYAVLTGCDRTMYEAADIDGAGTFQKMFFLSLPALKNMIVVGIIMNSANILRFDFGMAWFLTGTHSSLQPSTDVIETYMYRALRFNGDYAASAAVGFLQGVVGIVLSVITNMIARRFSRESSLF